ncbi:MAG TPA: gluconate 2-dehydrogenase subunit 3 family protein [Xanthobacteraceae bacterium]|nr:gluconate 2-dehydrogenase subunit 3 family protein [Xanthobacteraceae bacterium]
MTDDTIARRNFLLGAGTAVAAGLAPLAEPTQAPAAQPPPAPAAAAPAPSEPLLTLSATEAAFLSAVADTMIPADELSPSGSECGVVVFIDRQLAGAYGAGAKTYRNGPFRRGKPEQGYQLALTPREYFATGIVAANEWTRKTYGKEFDRLSAGERTAALAAMERGTAEFENFSAHAFFGRLHAIVMEGFFSDPMHGGNRNKAGWIMLGFPGLPATYADKVDAYFDKRYVAPPQSIADFSGRGRWPRG